VGQGDSILIRYPLSGNCILIDTGSSYNYYKLRKRLFAEGIYKIDYLILSHDDSDHNGNVENLSTDFNIGSIITEGKDIEFGNIFLDYLETGTYDNDNDNSLVYYLEINNVSFLFTGDISDDVERVLIQKYGPLSVDVLKVSHHGSYTATSPYFISNILPSYAVISTSGMYNHPHYTVINTLKRYLVHYFITKESGTVSFYFSRFVDFIKTDKNEFVIIR